MLEIDPVTILAEIFNFLILAVVLYFLLFKPMAKSVMERADAKNAALESALAKEEEAEQKLKMIEERLSNLDFEIEERLQKAYRQAQEDTGSLIQATHKEAEMILIEAEKEAENFKKHEFNQLRETLVSTILNISSQILRRSTPDVVHENLVDELTTEIWDLGKRDMQQVRTLRDSLTERTPTVYVTSARELTPEKQRSLVKTFGALADKNVNMEIEINPDLIAGVHARIGDLIIENSLAMELSDLKTEVLKSLEESVDGE